MKTARYWMAGDNQTVSCQLCPHACRIAPGRRGRCFARQNMEGTLYASTWGRPVAIAVDPMEKKPLYHFLPGEDILSLGTLGCNLSCRFCQNWSLSHPDAATAALADRDGEVTPEAVAKQAQASGLPAVAMTYNEPAVAAEYAIDIAVACHARGIRMAAVTSGYISGEGRLDFFNAMDAANVDLKSMSDDFYRTTCGASLAPVLDTLQFIRRETACWLELTTLLIPGLNDSEDELNRLTAWVAAELGPQTPLHFSAFYGAGDMTDHASTPPATLQAAQKIAKANGLHYVYLGNVARTPTAANTCCAVCGHELISRETGRGIKTGMAADGTCTTCRTPCPGIWH